jgi:hypothetical protein
MIARPAFVGLAALAALTASAARSQDRRVSTAWVPEQITSGPEQEVEEDRPFLQALLGPTSLVRIDEPARAVTGGELLPAGARLFRLMTRVTPVFCTTGASKRWGVIHRIVVVHLCLVDDDGDGRLDSYYDERADHAFLPMFRGEFPAERAAISPISYSPLPSLEFSMNPDGSSLPREQRFSVFLQWQGSTIRCFIGYPRFRILRVPLTDFAVIPRRELLPASVSVCGAQLRILSREHGRLRLVVESAYPPEPIEIGVRWQLF